jgi:hypothetical protein
MNSQTLLVVPQTRPTASMFLAPFCVTPSSIVLGLVDSSIGIF